MQEKNLSFQTSHERWHSGFVGTPLLFTMHLMRFPKRTQRTLKATRNTPATVPQLQSLTSALLLSCRPPPFPCQSRGNSPSVTTTERILRKTRPAQSNQAMSSWPGQQDGQKGSRTQEAACHLCIIHLLTLHPEGHLLRIGFWWI